MLAGSTFDSATTFFTQIQMHLHMSMVDCSLNPRLSAALSPAATARKGRAIDPYIMGAVIKASFGLPELDVLGCEGLDIAGRVNDAGSGRARPHIDANVMLLDSG